MEIIRGKQNAPIKCVIYGPEGIGKSTFASRFPDPLFIDTEGSTKHMDVSRTPTPRTWNELRDQVLYVRDNPDVCKTLVIDTADWAEILCIQEVCIKGGKTGIEDFGYGKGYTYLAEEFSRLLRALSEVNEKGIHICITAHAALRKFEQPDEAGAYDRWEMKLQKKTAPLLKEWPDMLLFANYETMVIKDENGKARAHGGKRVMYTSHNPVWDAKNRFDLPEKLDFTFDGIAHLFGDVKTEAPKKRTNKKKADPKPEPEKVQQEEVKEEQSPEPNVAEVASERLQKLRELMEKDGIEEDEIQELVAKKGIYPEHVPISAYDDDFIQKAFLDSWEKVKELVLQDRIPF